jgi:hypothetical protein
VNINNDATTTRKTDKNLIDQRGDFRRCLGGLYGLPGFLWLRGCFIGECFITNGQLKISETNMDCQVDIALTSPLGFADNLK